MAQQTISKMETVQTAVEWLFKKMAQTPMTNWYEIRIKALAMEKEQIINAWRNGDNDSMYDFKELDKLAEEYYNETYEKDNA